MAEKLTLVDLKKTLDNGTAREMFPVGTQIDDAWTDIGAVRTYQAPLIVAHYGEFNTLDKDGSIVKRLCAVLIREDTLPGKWEFGGYGYKAMPYECSLAASAMLNQYADGCSEELSKLATDFMLTKDSVNIMPAKHFLPSVEELAIITDTNNGLDLGAAWELFRKTPTVARRDDCQELACSSPYYTRSVCNSGCHEGSVWAIGHCGCPDTHSPKYTISFRPACVIAQN